MAEQRASGSITETPEFKAAVVAEVQRALASAREAAGTPANDGDNRFAERLAMAIAGLSDGQGPGAKRFVAPEILQARAEARRRMMDAIIEARSKHILPRYTLKAKVYLDEVKVDPMWVDRNHMQHATIIEWPGAPNEAMRPCVDHLGEDGSPKFAAANEAAAAIYRAFRESIGTATPLQDDRPQRVTAGGLVVHGAPRPTRDTGLRQPGEKEQFGEGLRVPHRDSGKTTRILGTLADPARESLI